MNHTITPFFTPLDAEESRVYISGPMTGFPGSNGKEFAKKAATLRADGYAVCNPVETSIILGDLSHPDYLRFDFARLLEADWMFALSGWEDSSGARAEIYMAVSMGLGVWSDYDLIHRVQLEEVIEALRR